MCDTEYARPIIEATIEESIQQPRIKRRRGVFIANRTQANSRGSDAEQETSDGRITRVFQLVYSAVFLNIIVSCVPRRHLGRQKEEKREEWQGGGARDNRSCFDCEGLERKQD